MYLRNVYWDYDSWDLIEESLPVLDSLVDFLNTNRHLTIEVSAHTDERGSADYNLKLSEKRAKGVADYLLSWLIESGRISIVGNGEEKPIIPNEEIALLESQDEKEKMYQVNRRLEIKITSIDYAHELYLPNDKYFKSDAVLRSYEVIFMFAKAELLDTSLIFLNSFANFLLQHPNLVIEIGVHSDSRGSNQYSTRLTQRRAEAIRDYLMAIGIDENRLVAKGYEELNLLYSDSEINRAKTAEEKEKLHQMNRRSEFKIISLGYLPKEE